MQITLSENHSKNQLSSHFSVERSLSIHDTPPPKDMLDPIKLEAILCADLAGLNAPDPLLEPAEYDKSPSAHSEEALKKYSEGTVSPSYSYNETTPEPKQINKKKTPKKSRRSKRKRKSRSLRKPRTNQKLGTGQAYSYEWFENVNHYSDLLTDVERVFMILMWTTNYNACPLRVIAEGLGFSKASVRVLENLLEEYEYIKLKQQFAEYETHKGEYIQTKKKIHSYRECTSKGKALREAIKEKAQFGTPIPKELELPIAIIINSRGQKVPKSTERIKPSEERWLHESVKENLGLPTSLDKSKHLCQDNPVDCKFSFDGKNGDIFDLDAYQRELEARYDQLLAKQGDIEDEKMILFDMFGHKEDAAAFPPYLKKRINKLTMKGLAGIITWVDGKEKKGTKIQSYVKYFVWRMNKKKAPTPWLTKRAEEYMLAIENKKAVGGIDSDRIVEAIIALQEKTGQKITKRDLRGILGYNTQLLKTALEYVLFKSNRLNIQNWIGYTHALCKKKSMEQIKNMYKSEERRNKEHEAETQLLKVANAHSDKQAWDKLLGDLEEADRELAATGTSGDVWG